MNQWTTAEKAMLTRDLNKAAESLSYVFKQVHSRGHVAHAKRLRELQQAVAKEIGDLNGGPVKLEAREITA
jgi:hypothetical protein